MEYQRKQIGRDILLIMGISTGVLIILPFVAPDETVWPLISVLALFAFLFNSLVITVDEGKLQWYFGPGFWKKSVPLDSILAVSEVDVHWYNGLGIRRIASGWLYCVSQRTAIEITLKNGTVFTLGTDDRDSLVALLHSKITPN